MLTIEFAQDLKGYVVYKGDLVPFLWTHLKVFSDEEKAKAEAEKIEGKAYPVKDIFEIETYIDWATNKNARRLTTRSWIKREVRKRK